MEETNVIVEKNNIDVEEAQVEKVKKSDEKFCKHCGAVIQKDAVICLKCGLQVEELKGDSQPNIVINNENKNINTAQAFSAVAANLRMKNKWVALGLCIFLGMFGAHKFYEGKIGMGILYIFTMGLFGFGWVFDSIALLFKPNPYYI